MCQQTRHPGVALLGEGAGYLPIPEEDPSAEWRTVVVQRLTQSSVDDRWAGRCGEKQGSGRRLSWSSLHTSRPGWRSPRFRPGGKYSPPLGVPASVCPERSKSTCSPSLRGQPEFVRIALAKDGGADAFIVWPDTEVHTRSARRPADSARPIQSLIGGTLTGCTLTGSEPN